MNPVAEIEVVAFVSVIFFFFFCYPHTSLRLICLSFQCERRSQAANPVTFRHVMQTNQSLKVPYHESERFTNVNNNMSVCELPTNKKSPFFASYNSGNGVSALCDITKGTCTSLIPLPR